MDEIRSEKVLIVEGRDEVQFFQSFLRSIEEDQGVYIHSVDGKRNFRTRIPVITKARGFNNVKRIGIIADADASRTATFQSICSAVHRAGLPVPEEPNSCINREAMTTGVFIMPGIGDVGMLEDLCMATVSDHASIPCIDSFFNCLDRNGLQIKNLSKARAQIYLASMPEIASSVGIGAQKSYWNFDAPAMDKLRMFISSLFTA